MVKQESCLENLKKSYKKIQTKFDLPAFEKLNEEFQIEKVAEMETDFLLREIRKLIADKLSNYMRFIEALLHPVGAPMFIFSILKTLNKNDRAILEEIYKKLMEFEVRLIEIDAVYFEKEEIEFIKDVYDSWQTIKRDILKITGSIKKNWNNKFETNNKGYFG